MSLVMNVAGHDPASQLGPFGELGAEQFPYLQAECCGQTLDRFQPDLLFLPRLDSLVKLVPESAYLRRFLLGELMAQAQFLQP